jgi:hypothetical protein
MRSEFKKFESDGRFGLFYPANCFSGLEGDGSLGTGSYEQVYAFKSEEGREYFIQSREWQEISGKLSREVKDYQEFLASLLTKTGRIKRGSSKKIAAWLAANVHP